MQKIKIKIKQMCWVYKLKLKSYIEKGLYYGFIRRLFKVLIVWWMLKITLAVRESALHE